MPLYTYEDLKKVNPECFKPSDNIYGKDSDVCYNSSIVYIFGSNNISNLSVNLRKVFRFLFFF